MQSKDVFLKTLATEAAFSMEVKVWWRPTCVLKFRCMLKNPRKSELLETSTTASLVIMVLFWVIKPHQLFLFPKNYLKWELLVSMCLSSWFDKIVFLLVCPLRNKFLSPLKGNRTRSLHTYQKILWLLDWSLCKFGLILWHCHGAFVLNRCCMPLWENAHIERTCEGSVHGILIARKSLNGLSNLSVRCFILQQCI